jgi:hypothetical protein
METTFVGMKEDSGNLVFYRPSDGLVILKIDGENRKVVFPNGSGLRAGTSPTGKIFVDTDGSDTDGNGTREDPYASLTKALAAVTTARKTVLMRGGDYDEAAAVVWPDVNGVIVKAVDGPVVITSEASTTHVIGIDPAAATSTWSATLDGIEIENGDGQIGLQVDNSAVGKRINLFLKDFTGSLSGDTPGASIDINRSGGAGDAIRVYADGSGNTIEGLVTFITESTDDRLRFKGYRLIGGLTVEGAVASEVTLFQCGVLAGGLTVDNTNLLSNIGCWYETDDNPNVYTALADHYDS